MVRLKPVAVLNKLNFFTFRMSIRIVVLASGGGSNFQAILNKSQNCSINAQVIALFSDVANAYAVERAKFNGVPTIVLNPSNHPDRVAYDRELHRRIENLQPDLIVLAGFMRILSKEFVNHWENRIMNIHPSLLPAYKGMNTHQRVLDANDTVHGATVHFVTAELDNGPIIVQAQINVHRNESAAELQQRIHEQEHKIYPMAIQWFAQGRLSVMGDKVLLDGRDSPEQFQIN